LSIRACLLTVAVLAAVFAFTLRPTPRTPYEQAAASQARVFLTKVHPTLPIPQYKVVSIRRVKPGDDYGWRVDFMNPRNGHKLHARSFFGEDTVAPFRIR
jgi:hypothetical protein